MKADLIVDISILYGQPTLAGSKNGEAFLPKLLDAAKHQPRGAVVAFSFAKLDLVTASFFRAAFRAFRDYARTNASLYPIFTNANDETLEEIRHFAEDVRDAFLFAKLTRAGDIQSPFLVGTLDEKQAMTLNALSKLGEADAARLLEAYPEKPAISSAAWSNRLASLAAKGLVDERLEGRVKKYRPIHKDLRHGPSLHS